MIFLEFSDFLIFYVNYDIIFLSPRKGDYPTMFERKCRYFLRLLAKVTLVVVLISALVFLWAMFKVGFISFPV